MKSRCALFWLLAILGYAFSADVSHKSPELSGVVKVNEDAKIERHDPGRLGQVSGLAVDDAGNLFAFHRGSRTWEFDSFDSENNFNTKKYGAIKDKTLTVFDPNGRVIWTAGANRFYMPHGLSLDADNMWVTDVGLHQVFKIPKGTDEPVLALGTAFKNGNDNLHFCKPTDVAVAADGTIFVADGYCNSRIVKFSPDGKYVSEWGQPVDGSQMPPYPPGQFSIPHSLTLIEDWDLLCVADRENERVQCFSAGLGRRGLPAGSFIKKAEGLGRVFAIDHKDHFLAGVTGAGVDGTTAKLFLVNLNTGNSEIIEKGMRAPHDVALALGEEGVPTTAFVADISHDHPGIDKIEL